MVALIWILMLSVTALAGLRLLMPPRLRYLVGPPHFAVATLLPIVAMLSPLYLIFAVAAAAIVAVAPRLGVSGAGDAYERRLRLLFFAVPLLPMLQYTVMAGPFTIVQLTYFSIICLGSFAVLSFAGSKGVSQNLAAWDMTFLAMMAVQLFMDTRSTDAMFFVRSVVQVTLNLGLPYLLFSRALAGVRDPAALLFNLIMAGGIIALIAIFESARHWLLYDAIPGRLGADPEFLSGYAKLRGGMLRARATFPESTGLSLFLGASLTVLFALRRQIASPRLVAGIGAILFAGMVCTFARVGYIVTGVGFCMCLLHERRFGALAVMLVTLPSIALIGITLADTSSTVAAALGTGNDSAGSIDYRTMLYEAGLRVIVENPWFGLAQPDLLDALEHLRQGEGIIDLVNQPLTIAMRGGLLGSAIYFAMTLRVLFVLFFDRRRMNEATAACACACFAAIIALLVGLTTTSFGRNETTFILLLAAGAGLAARSHAAVTRSPPRPAAIAPDGLSPRQFSGR